MSGCPAAGCLDVLVLLDVWMFRRPVDVLDVQDVQDVNISSRMPDVQMSLGIDPIFHLLFHNTTEYLTSVKGRYILGVLEFQFEFPLYDL